MDSSCLRCVELYCGIGGMHYALKESNLPFDVIAAVDINPVTNTIYAHNFPSTKLIAKCITSLTANDLDSFNVDIVLMSPPCQPFTRVGKQQDTTDERTKSFLHILHLLPQLANLPKYFMVENVHGFEISETHNQLLKVLQQLDYGVQEFMLTPTQFGIPNSRLRYYLLAKRRPLVFHCSIGPEINTRLPECSVCSCADQLTAVCSSSDVRPLHEYLEDTSSVDQFLISAKFYRHIWVMDLVDANSTCSCCFTKRYGRHVEGAGSVIKTNDIHVDLSIYKSPEAMNTPQFSAAVRSLGLRFFTPREIANILGFPSEFECPSCLTTIQCYRALGNSLNVHVVSVLLRLLTAGDFNVS